MRIDHVQVAIPPDGEAEARAFWSATLGLEEIPKPRRLAERGGCWFRAEVNEIHCGVDPAFAPATKAHPALEVDDFDAYVEAVTAAGHTVTPDELYPGRRRFYVNDPFGNRIEIIERYSEPRPDHPFVFGAYYRVRRDFGISAPDASFDRGEVVRFLGYSGYSRWDDAHVYRFEATATGARRDMWWFADDSPEDIMNRFEPTWPPTIEPRAQE